MSKDQIYEIYLERTIGYRTYVRATSDEEAQEKGNIIESRTPWSDYASIGSDGPIVSLCGPAEDIDKDFIIEEVEDEDDWAKPQYNVGDTFKLTEWGWKNYGEEYSGKVYTVSSITWNGEEFLYNSDFGQALNKDEMEPVQKDEEEEKHATA